MQATVFTYDNFEQFDCTLFHESIKKTEELAADPDTASSASLQK